MYLSPNTRYADILYRFLDVEMLLGEPIQQAISSESGIDLVFDSLSDIIAGLYPLISFCLPSIP